MIFRFLVVRKDTKAPIQGAKIVLEHGETDGITDIQGRADIRAEWYAVYRYSVTAAFFGTEYGEGTFPAGDVQNVTVEMGAWVGPTDPPPPGEEIIGTVGTSCDLLQKYMFERTWYSYRQRYTGKHANWDSEYSDVEYQANQDLECFAPPPPPPKTIEDVQKDVDILRGTLQGISSRVQDLVTSVTEIWKALAELDARVKAWVLSLIATVETRIDGAMANLAAWTKDRISAIEKRIETVFAELKTWVGERIAVLDARIDTVFAELKTWAGEQITALEKRTDARFAALDSWLEERIIAVLLRALDREAKELK